MSRIFSKIFTIRGKSLLAQQLVDFEQISYIISGIMVESEKDKFYKGKLMKSSPLFQERLDRIKKAVSLQKPDRVPVVLEYGAFAARVTHTPLPEFLLDYPKSVAVMQDAYQRVAEVASADAMNYGSFSPYGLSYLWLSQVRVPGVDLPDDFSYQVIEKEMLNRRDYDLILDNGWSQFYPKFMQEKILVGIPKKYLPANQPQVDVRAEWEKMDVPVLRSNSVAPPFEFLCGGRSLTKFAFDLVEIPDKVEAVMAEMVRGMSAPVCNRAKKQGFMAVWVGGWRSAPIILSQPMWNRFVWPYFRQLVYEVVEQGLIAILHLDSNWDRELERFKELPQGKCVLALDGETDIFKAKDILGDHMCIMGDVPAAMLFLKDPDDVFDYSKRLIREIGPNGFILQSGCDIPENAKLENVQAMVAAAAEGF